jgi:hypothetical protein
MKSRQCRAVYLVCKGRTHICTGFGGGNLSKESLGRPRHRWNDNIENVGHCLDSSG